MESSDELKAPPKAEEPTPSPEIVNHEEIQSQEASFPEEDPKEIAATPASSPASKLAEAKSSLNQNAVPEPPGNPSNGKESPGRSASERTHSGSSSVAGVVDAKETIEGQGLDRLSQAQLFGAEKGFRRDSNPVGIKMIQIPVSDSGSFGSVPSLLDSVGAATLAEQRLQAAQVANAKVPSTDTSQQTPIAGHLNLSNVADPAQIHLDSSQQNAPQYIQQENMVSQATSLLVAVPFQQSSSQHHSSSQAVQEYTGEYTAQAQQTVLYQIPGVVTLPMGTTPQDAQNSSNISMHQVQQQTTAVLQQPIETIGPPIGQMDQIVGMVGTIPIVKLQDGTMHLVKKKKGRFKFLEDTPTVTTGGMPAGPAMAGPPPPINGAGMTPVAQPPPAPPPAPANHAPVPANIAVPSQNQSITSIVSQLSAPLGPPMGQQQGFDGSNAPKVKKKGRFVVTSVKDPVPIPKSIQTQNPPPAVGPLEGPNLTPPAPQSQSQPQQQGQYQQTQQQPHAQLQVPLQQQFPPQNQNQQTPQHNYYQQAPNTHPTAPSEVIAHLSIPTTFETQFLQPIMQQSIPQTAVDGPAYIAQPMQGFAQPQSMAQQYTIDNFHQLQQPPPPPVDQQIPHTIQYANQPNISNPTPPPTPVQSGGKESPGKRQPVAQQLPNVVVPKPPHAADKPAGQPVPPKKPAQKRPAKAPQSIGTNGMYGNIGLGKISYFLDQMKGEVSEADRMVKHLQTDLKVMRDKNKELEAKNRELDRKLKEEIALREKAEARCVEFRKRLRATGETTASTASIQEKMGEGQAAKKNDGTANGMASKDAKQNGPTNGNGPKAAAKPVVPPVAGKPPGKPNAVAAGAALAKDGKTAASKIPVKQPNGQGTNLAKKAQPAAGVAKEQPTSAPKTVIDQTAPSQPAPTQAEEAPSAASEAKTPVPSPTKIEPNQRNATSGEGPSSNVAETQQPVHSRSNSNESASKDQDTSIKAKPETPARAEIPRPSGVTKSNSAPAQQANQIPPAAPQTPQQRPPPVSRAVPPKGTSLSDFDPLGPSASTSNIEGDIWPVISFPTNVSLESVPISSTASFFQHSGGQAYSTASLPERYNQATFVGENPYMVPITFGMTSSDVNGQQHITNGFQMQQPFMLQQPIMFQQVQGGVQQWSAPVPQQQTGAANPQQFYQQHQHMLQQQQQQQQQQHPPPQHQTVPSNPFDPFSS